MLTHKERKALDFIVEYQRTNDGLSPTFREISMAVGHTMPKPSAAHHLLDCLEDRGFIKRKRARQRAITVLKRWHSGARYAVFVWNEQIQQLVPFDGHKRSEAGSATNAPASK